MRDEPEVAQARVLFREYQESLGVDLCFQGFEDELASLPAPYSAPDGILSLASWSGHLAGCVGFKPLFGDVCELKRLYVRPAYRGHGIGRALCLVTIEEAEERGYRWMRLDTLERLESALRLYRDLGFTEIDPYYANPLEEPVIYMERSLTSRSP